MTASEEHDDRTKQLLGDFLEFADAGARLVARGRESYDADEMLRLAAEAIVTRLGEAVARLDEAFIETHPEVRWRPMRAMRNLVAHEYGAVDHAILWNALARDLPHEAALVRQIVDGMPGAGVTVVVGAAIVDGGRVLATRRTSPPELAGRWEFPGGKVEPGETPDAALVREVGEELGCVIEVTGWLAGSAPIGTTYELRVALARLVDGDPHPHEHDAVRWLGPGELGEVDWLEPDRPFLAELGARLTR